MSLPLYGTRPVIPTPGEQPQNTGLNVSSRIVRLDPGLFGLSLMPSPTDRTTGLPAARVSLPPGPSVRREAAGIAAFRADGWMTANDEPTLIRILAGGADVLVTLYWSAADPLAAPPSLKLVRLNQDAAPGGQFDTTGGAAAVAQPLAPAPRIAEVVAHIEGIGDVDGKLGEWIGMRGSGRAIEGFSLSPPRGITADDFEVRAVLGRDWLSPWLPGDRFCGSRGLALPLRGFCLRLHQGASARFDLACFARFVDGSEIGPVGSDQNCAAPSMAALEAFQVLLRPRVA